MRIVQIIDSLDAGGAERMAVNYANGLCTEIEFSGLVVTRKEGALFDQISQKVTYLYLNKKYRVDLKAVYKLRKFVIDNKVEIVHAHSTSFFIAFLLKLTTLSIKLVWHDHYGDSEFLHKRPSFSLKIIVPFFKGIVVVNQQLKIWAEKKLKVKNVVYLPNFPTYENNAAKQTVLSGMHGKRIVSIANLRIQKNHFLLLEVAKKIKKSHPDWTFHLIGKDFEDDYSKQIKSLIIDFDLDKTVYFYGSRNDIKNILEQSTIGVLTSQSEGLPVALLEYGLYQKPVVVTNVGEIPKIVENGKNGFVVETNSVLPFYNSVINLIDNKYLLSDFGTELQKSILTYYSEKSVINQYLNWLK